MIIHSSERNSPETKKNPNPVHMPGCTCTHMLVYTHAHAHLVLMNTFLYKTISPQKQIPLSSSTTSEVFGNTNIFME